MIRPTYLSLLLACLLFWIDAKAASATIRPQESAPADNSGVVYTVQLGDSLAEIARNELGNETLWPQIVTATNARAAVDPAIAPIANPRLLYAGQKIWLAGATPLPVASKGFCTTEPVSVFPQTGANGLWGYVDAQGSFVIAPQFAIAREFAQGLAVVSVDGLNFGYIDGQGEMRIAATFADAGHFAEGRARVRSGDPEHIWTDADQLEYALSGFIDCSGEYVVTPQYLQVESYMEGVVRVEQTDGAIHYLDLTGKLVMPQSSAHQITEQRMVTRREVIAPDETRDADCALSGYLSHEMLFKCTVEGLTYDPCLLDRDGQVVVCNYPSTPFSVSSFEFLRFDWSDAELPSLWVKLIGNESVTCQGLVKAIEISTGSLSHKCSDGSYLQGGLREAADQEQWFAEKVRVSDVSADGVVEESTIVAIAAIESYSTSVVNLGPGPSDAMPPTFWFNHARFRGSSYWQ